MVDDKCEVCQKEIFKYKCPICVIKFCCVACFKSHKESEKCKEPVVDTSTSNGKGQNSAPEYEFETEDTVKPKKLRRLGNDKKIRKVLKNSHLRDMISCLNSTSNPAQGVEQAMKEPIFVEFVEHCLRVVEKEDTSSDSSDDDSD